MRFERFWMCAAILVLFGNGAEALASGVVAPGTTTLELQRDLLRAQYVSEYHDAPCMTVNNCPTFEVWSAAHPELDPTKSPRVFVESLTKRQLEFGSQQFEQALRASLHMSQFSEELRASNCSEKIPCLTYDEWTTLHPEIDPKQPNATFLSALLKRRQEFTTPQVLPAESNGLFTGSADYGLYELGLRMWSTKLASGLLSAVVVAKGESETKPNYLDVKFDSEGCLIASGSESGEGGARRLALDGVPICSLPLHTEPRR